MKIFHLGLLPLYCVLWCPDRRAAAFLTPQQHALSTHLSKQSPSSDPDNDALLVSQVLAFPSSRTFLTATAAPKPGQAVKTTDQTQKLKTLENRLDTLERQDQSKTLNRLENRLATLEQGSRHNGQSSRTTLGRLGENIPRRFGTPYGQQQRTRTFSNSNSFRDLNRMEARLADLERDVRHGQSRTNSYGRQYYRSPYQDSSHYGTPYQDLRDFQNVNRYGPSRGYNTGRTQNGMMDYRRPVRYQQGGRQPLNTWEDRLSNLGGRSRYDGYSQNAASRSRGSGGMRLADQIRDRTPGIQVQGASLETWSLTNPYVDRVKVALGTDGRPLDATIELWQGPNNAPFKMSVFSEDGFASPVSTIIETPRETSQTIAIRNVAQLTFPLVAHVDPSGDDHASRDLHRHSYMYAGADMTTIQGDSLRTFPFYAHVESVQVMLRTDGGPLAAKIELMQGPNNNKQTIEVYSENGIDRPVWVELETPGNDNVVRVVNTGPLEFPLYASVEPTSVGQRRGHDYYHDYGGAYDRFGETNAIRSGRGRRGGYMTARPSW